MKDVWRDKDEFKARVLEWASKLNVKVRMVTMRPMRNKWASCSTAGNLHFDSGLLLLDRKLGDYVIVHELCHLKVHDHGIEFYRLLTRCMPDWQDRKRRLEAMAVRYS